MPELTAQQRKVLASVYAYILSLPDLKANTVESSSDVETPTGDTEEEARCTTTP